LWLDRLDQEHPNLRAALTWLLANGDPAVLGLAADLAWFWYVRGAWSEGRTWLEQATAMRGGTDASRARALLGAGLMAREQWDLDTARELLDQAVPLAPDPHTKGLAVNELAGVWFYQNHPERARDLLREAIDLLERSGDRTRR